MLDYMDSKDSRGHTVIVAGTVWLWSSPWLGHTVNTQRRLLMYPFGEEMYHPEKADISSKKRGGERKGSGEQGYPS